MSTAPLVFRAYPIQAATLAALIYDGPCIVDAIFTSAGPTTDTSFFDGTNTSGRLIYQSVNQPSVNMFGLRTRLYTGLYIAQAGACPWTVVIASVPA